MKLWTALFGQRPKRASVCPRCDGRGWVLHNNPPTVDCPICTPLPPELALTLELIYFIGVDHPSSQRIIAGLETKYPYILEYLEAKVL